MVGGSDHAYERLRPVVESIAALVDGTPCCAHVGPDAAGHFVKMVHNGIEYADMQLIAESYDLLRSVAGLDPAAIADVFEEWNGGDLESFLIEMTSDVLRHTDGETGTPFVDVIDDAAEQKGTGRWTVQSALDLGVPVTGIAEATFARSLSGHTAQRAAAREMFSTSPEDQQRRRRPRGVRRPGPRRALRLEGGRLRPGLRPDRRRRRGERLGRRPRHGGHDLARRLHHPRPVPRPDPRGVRRRARPDHAAHHAVLRRRGQGRRRRLARGGGHGGVRRGARRRRSGRRCPTSTACAASGCPPR